MPIGGIKKNKIAEKYLEERSDCKRDKIHKDEQITKRRIDVIDVT